METNFNHLLGMQYFLIARNFSIEHENYEVPIYAWGFMDLEYALERLKWFSEWNRTLRFCYEQRILGYNQTLCLLNLAYSSIVVLGFLTSWKDRQLKFSAYPSENSQNLSLFRQLLFLLFKSGDPWKKNQKAAKTWNICLISVYLAMNQ